MLQQRLADRRSRRVVFVSHCLLNENVRYLGGACRPGPITERLREWEDAGVGICQMPCPEQLAWGGVLKRRIWPAFGARRSVLWPLRGLVLAAFDAYTRFRYALLARRVVAEIRDYRRSGFEVIGLVGVDGSPSCGIRTTVDIRSWLEAVGQMVPSELDRNFVNDAVIASARPGRGRFTSAVIGRLRREGLDVPLAEHDLLHELGLAEAARDGWRSRAEASGPTGDAQPPSS